MVLEWYRKDPSLIFHDLWWSLYSVSLYDWYYKIELSLIGHLFAHHKDYLSNCDNQSHVLQILSCNASPTNHLQPVLSWSVLHMEMEGRMWTMRSLQLPTAEQRWQPTDRQWGWWWQAPPQQEPITTTRMKSEEEVAARFCSLVWNNWN